MKNSLVYGLVMILIVIASCTPKGGSDNDKDSTASKDSTEVSKKVEENFPEAARGFDKSFKGTLGPQKPIRANIRRYGDKLSGTYWFTADGKDILLEGSIKEESFELNELDSTGNKIATIKGKFSEKDSLMTGEWVKGEEKLKFELMAAPAMAPSKWSLGHAEVKDSSKTGGCKIHVSYPKFIGLSDVLMQKRVNELIKVHFPIDEMEASLQNCTQPFKDDINYEVSYLRGDLISISKTHHLFKDGKPTPGESWGININFHTGKVYELQDFFRPDLLPALNKMLQERINKSCGNTLTPEQLAKLELKPNNIEGFSLNDNKTFKKPMKDSTGKVVLDKRGKKVMEEKITREGTVVFHLTDRLPKKLQITGYVKLYYHDIKKYVNPHSLLMHVITRYENQMERQRKELASN